MEDPNKGGQYFRDRIQEGYSGRNDSGVVFGQPVLRGARAFTGEEVAQFLRHLSVFFWNYVNLILGQEDQEVEAMFVNDRVVISANNTKTMGELFSALMEEDTLLDAFLTTMDIESSRGQRTVERFQDEVMTPDTTSDVQRLMQGLGLEQIKNALKQARVRRAGKFGVILTDPGYAEKLVLVEGLDAHAEQKLLMLLVQSSVPKNAPVHIRGKKRPCFGCWLCLRFVRDALGYGGLSFNDRPGKAWIAPVDELKTFVQQGLKLGYDGADLARWADDLIAGYKQSKIKTHISTSHYDKSEDPGFDSESDDDLDRYQHLK